MQRPTAPMRRPAAAHSLAFSSWLGDQATELLGLCALVGEEARDRSEVGAAPIGYHCPVRAGSAMWTEVTPRMPRALGVEFVPWTRFIRGLRWGDQWCPPTPLWSFRWLAYMFIPYAKH